MIARSRRSYVPSGRVGRQIEAKGAKGAVVEDCKGKVIVILNGATCNFDGDAVEAVNAMPDCKAKRELTAHLVGRELKSNP